MENAFCGFLNNSAEGKHNTTAWHDRIHEAGLAGNFANKVKEKSNAFLVSTGRGDFALCSVHIKK